MRSTPSRTPTQRPAARGWALRQATVLVAAAGIAVVGPTRADGALAAAAAGTPPTARIGWRVILGEGAVPHSVGARARVVADAQQVTVTAPASSPTAHRVRLAGTVSPIRAGLRITVQRRSGGGWRTVRTARLRATGTWSVTVRTPKYRGWVRYRAVVARNGTLPSRSVEARRIDNYSRHTYVVAKRGAVTMSMTEFAAQAAETYADARGWRAGHHRFVRTAKDGDFTLVLAEARYLPLYSPVCSVKYSCRAGRYVVINQDRWRRGSEPFTGSLRDYRSMVVNHETGHWLGRHHAFCGGAEQPAPVMQQQSKSLSGCRPNAWPLPFEIRAVT